MSKVLPTSGLVPDTDLEAVRDTLSAIPKLASRVGMLLRQAFDETIDAERSARFRIEQLEKTEKTYIGTKVEILLRNEFGLLRGNILDNLIAGHEVDTKFSLSGNWMIPREALGQTCLLIHGNDNTGRLSVGLLRMSPDVLTQGTNQDGKASVSAAGKLRISWLIEDHTFPPNFLLGLDDQTRERILTPPAAKRRIQALFRNVTGRVIPREAILQVGRSQDSLKRAREAKAELAPHGYEVLCATYQTDRRKMHSYGVKEPRPDDWLSIYVGSNSNGENE